MDLRQLNALLAVADHGGFSAAADALHTVQSNVSAHVARLERELGATLVDRGAGRLTEEGETVVARARRINAELEGLVADVGAIRHDVRGTTRLGVIGTTARWLVPRLFDVMGERHPGVHLIVVDATSTSLEPRLSSGSLDLAVINLPVPDRDLSEEALFDEDLMLVVPADHPLADRTVIELRELENMPLLMPPVGTALRGEIDAPAKAAGITLQPMAEVDGVRLIASLAIDGRGPAVLPATAVPSPGQVGAWRKIKIAGLPRRRVGIALRRRGLPAAPTRAVLEVLREIAGNATDPEGLYPPGTPLS
ncbi:MAG TPA: LysR family transcriptional regulator [Acidimicrobiales bacterium]|jgi:LysR family hydrogen peroxide-inducible transcriptional activator|nr:LysR family transcriptional regulator [Acidimicrobiales bacterium]